jgi:hypothetical protein
MVNDDQDLDEEYPVVAVEELQGGETGDTCRKYECDRTAYCRISRSRTHGNPITVGYCRAHLPDAALADDGTVRTFGEIHEPDGPNIADLSCEYLLTLQERDQHKENLLSGVTDLRRAGHLSAEEADLAERYLDAGMYEGFLDVLEAGFYCEAVAEADRD